MEGRSPSMKRLYHLIMYIVVIFLVTFVVVHFVAQRTEVSGISMMPSLSDGDQLIVDKISYRFREPERFDIVVFPYHYDTKQYFIKRIIGLPGETVQLLDGSIYINGERLTENYGSEVMMDNGVASEPVTLGEDEYFVLGDNRNHSEDSRYQTVGNIKKSEIIGRAWVRIWPFESAGITGH